VASNRRVVVADPVGGVWGTPLDLPVEHVSENFDAMSARSAAPRQQPADNAYGRPHLAREVLLAQPDLAALAPR